MLIGGCLLVGVGIGMILGDTGAGSVIGLGVGLILEYAASRNVFFKSRTKAPKDPKE